MSHRKIINLQRKTNFFSGGLRRVNSSLLIDSTKRGKGRRNSIEIWKDRHFLGEGENQVPSELFSVSRWSWKQIKYKQKKRLLKKKTIVFKIQITKTKGCFILQIIFMTKKKATRRTGIDLFLFFHLLHTRFDSSSLSSSLFFILFVVLDCVIKTAGKETGIVFDWVVIILELTQSRWISFCTIGEIREWNEPWEIPSMPRRELMFNLPNVIDPEFVCSNPEEWNLDILMRKSLCPWCSAAFTHKSSHGRGSEIISAIIASHKDVVDWPVDDSCKTTLLSAS